MRKDMSLSKSTWSVAEGTTVAGKAIWYFTSSPVSTIRRHPIRETYFWLESPILQSISPCLLMSRTWPKPELLLHRGKPATLFFILLIGNESSLSSQEVCNVHRHLVNLCGVVHCQTLALPHLYT